MGKRQFGQFSLWGILTDPEGAKHEKNEPGIKVWSCNYRYTHLAGQCRSGGDQAGYVVHILVEGHALCLVEPGRRSAGWSEYSDPEPTCTGCIEAFDALFPIGAEVTRYTE